MKKINIKLFQINCIEWKLEIKKAFFEGYYDADGCKTGGYNINNRSIFF